MHVRAGAEIYITVRLRGVTERTFFFKFSPGKSNPISMISVKLPIAVTALCVQDFSNHNSYINYKTSKLFQDRTHVVTHVLDAAKITQTVGVGCG